MPADLSSLDWRAHPSAWVRGFSCDHLRPLIIGRGPVRKEAIDVFRAMGMSQVGMLVSERDMLSDPQGMPAELRSVPRQHVHLVSDYGGRTPQEKTARIAEIVQIAVKHGYNAVFAGYGFLAEDPHLAEAVTAAGLFFIGPSAAFMAKAGPKDAARMLAKDHGLSVTPGGEVTVTGDRLEALLTSLWQQHPRAALRLKAVGGGGGKGQRVVAGPDSVKDLQTRLEAAKAGAHEALNEVGEAGDAARLVVELNLTDTRHLEVQLVGNGSWCVALGTRDCSFQMFEQKLLELSVTQDDLKTEIQSRSAQDATRRSLQEELALITRLERDGARFGAASGLDSVSTLECLARGEDYFFMEVNTRIQVEHRVTELTEGLEFAASKHERFQVRSIIALMVLLAVHGKRLPKPKRINLAHTSIEARINATDYSLSPEAGGLINGWSAAGAHELRDDQGISSPNPDTGQFVPYRITGSYDSNLALSIVVGQGRHQALTHLYEALRSMVISGDASTNRSFHLALVGWLRSVGGWARVSTDMVRLFLVAVSKLKQAAISFDVDQMWQTMLHQTLADQPNSVHRQAAAEILEQKRILITRPLCALLTEPYLLAAWLCEVSCLKQDNLLVWLDVMYKILNMTGQPGRAASTMIWQHDDDLLRAGLDFYKLLGHPHDSVGVNLNRRAQIDATHRGHQLGLLLVRQVYDLATRSGFFKMTLTPELGLEVPSDWKHPGAFSAAQQLLSPRIELGDGLISAPYSGMYFGKESPEKPPFVKVGDQVNVGDTLCLIEVMKMFHRVTSPAQGELSVAYHQNRDGALVRKGEPLFKIV